MHDNLNNELKRTDKNRGEEKKKTKHDNLDNNEKEQLRKYDKKKVDKRLQTLD